MDTPRLRERFLHQDPKVLCRSTFKEESAPYLPLVPQALMVGERLTFPVYLKVSEGESGEIRYLPYLEDGEVLEGSWLASLEWVGIKHLYCHEQDTERVIAYLNNHLLLTSHDPELRPRRFCLMREHLSLNLHRAFGTPHLGKHISLAKKSLENLGEILGEKSFPWKSLWDLLYMDYTLYNHSVNVGIMGMAFLVFLGKPPRDCLNMGLAGLFHDLGFTRLDEQLIHQVEPLDEKQWEAVKRHPEVGYQLLKNNGQIPLEALRLLREHHENADGSGYPQGLPLARQHPHSNILFMLEIYDGLTTYRPYRPAQHSFAALKTLQEAQGARGPACEPRTLKKFIKFLALA